MAEMLYQVLGDLKHLYWGPWGPENQANFGASYLQESPVYDLS
jgi:hypothetical protein